MKTFKNYTRIFIIAFLLTYTVKNLFNPDFWVSFLIYVAFWCVWYLLE